MKQLEHFSGLKPAVEDFHYERDAKELHIKQRIIDLTGGGTGILKGTDNELEVYVADPAQFLVAKVKSGEAYIQGEKIDSDSEQTVTLDDVETEANIVYAKYKLGDSTDPNATRQHYITGDPHVVWKIDSYELIAVKESQYVQTDDKLKLARVAKVGSDLTVTHDYRTYLKIDGDRWPNYVNESEFYVGGPQGTGTKVLKQQAAPPVPNRLDLSTGWDDAYRKTGESAGLISHRPAYIKAEFGDKGQGTASGITFTKTSNRVGAWTTNEWVDYYLTCSDGNSWKVVSNTTDTLTLEAGATPVNGNFWLGPNAAGYKLVIETLDPSTEEVVATSEQESQVKASPVKMEFIWHGLFADVKYQVKVASKGGWFQEEWSNFCTPEAIIAGGPKEIPDACADVLDGDPTITAQDDGIRVSWSVKSEYVNKVSGFEFCWTDDGTSTPDFDNKNHRKVFTDRNFIVLPAKMSSEAATTVVKSRMRAVDKAGRHCTTPKTLDDTNAKKYPGDLASIVTDYKNIIDEGGFPSLFNLLNKSIDLGTGQGKSVSALESEMIDGRGRHQNLGARLSFLEAGKIDWKYTRVVAKDGGNFKTGQAAINSIPTDSTDYWLIIFVNDGKGGYDEQIDIGNRYVGFLGFGGDVLIGPNQGRIYSSTENGVVLYMENIKIKCNASQTYDNLLQINEDASYYSEKPIILRGVTLDCGGNDNLTCALKYILDTFASQKGLVFENCRIKAKNNAVILDINGDCGTVTVHSWNSRFRSIDANEHGIEIALDNSGTTINIRSHGTSISTESLGSAKSIYFSGVIGSNGYCFMAHCKYIVAPGDDGQMTMTYDYGTINNQTNALFDAASDLDVLV